LTADGGRGKRRTKVEEVRAKEEQDGGRRRKWLGKAAEEGVERDDANRRVNSPTNTFQERW
jgi:hypothetical protein